MILVAGGSGRLGSDVVARLVARGLPVRVMTRDAARAGAALARSGIDRSSVEIALGDVRDKAAVRSAVTGVTTVVSAIQGFGGTHALGVTAVDAEGNRTMIEAADAAGVQHFVLLSMIGASPTAPTALARAKGGAERALRASSLGWTILRPSAYMETWGSLLGDPILGTGRAQVFGRGTNPVNFVAARDVAVLVERAVVDPAMRGRVVDVVGPENLSMLDVVGLFRATLGTAVPVRKVPPAALRVLSLVLRPMKPILAGQVAMARTLDTLDLRADDGPLRDEFPELPGTRFQTIVAACVAERRATTGGSSGTGDAEH